MIEWFVCHCVTNEWHMVVHDYGHYMARWRLVVDELCHH